MSVNLQEPATVERTQRMGKSVGRRPIYQSQNQIGIKGERQMREKILQAIRKFQIETYLVTEKTVEGAELYFIKRT